MTEPILVRAAKRVALASALALLSAATSAGPSSAATLDRATPAIPPAGMLRVCNEFAETVFVAFVFPQDGEWTSAGWLRVPNNVCRDTRIDARYYRGETNARRIGRDTTMQHTWGADRRFCIRDGKFVLRYANRRCGGARSAEFAGRPGRMLRMITFNADGVTVTRMTVDRDPGRSR
jgi:uncharacterized membrane protein